LTWVKRDARLTFVNARSRDSCIMRRRTQDMPRRLNDFWGRALALVHHGLAGLGLVALLLVFGGQVEVLRRAEADAPPAPAKPIKLDREPARPAVEAGNGRYHAIAGYLSRRYRIAGDAAEQLVAAAHVVGRELRLDPLLILAVIAVESRFNPIAESYAGAKGLMQVMPKVHEDKLQEHGGTGAVLDPMINISVGARILQQYIDDAGSIEAGLQYYNGAPRDASTRYAVKVTDERARLQLIVEAFERDGFVF
jgi:soluble lytic murein transglycosylase-like protein